MRINHNSSFQQRATVQIWNGSDLVQRFGATVSGLEQRFQVWCNGWDLVQGFGATVSGLVQRFRFGSTVQIWFKGLEQRFQVWCNGLDLVQGFGATVLILCKSLFWFQGFDTTVFIRCNDSDCLNMKESMENHRKIPHKNFGAIAPKQNRFPKKPLHQKFFLKNRCKKSNGSTVSWG